jgi:DNA-binding transcriptional LysR family regulator
MLSDEVPDLVALDLLASVAELGSLGRAAVAHGLSQPAVSMRMKALERRLGLGLLQRDSSGTRLTATGQRVVAQGRRVLGEVGLFMSEIEALRAEGERRLRAAASLTSAEHLVPAWMTIVARARPDVSLILEVTNSSRVVSAVSEGRVEIGFVEFGERSLPGLELRTVSSDRLTVVVAPGDPWAAEGRSVTGEELSATDLVVREPGSGTREVLEAALARWGGVRTHLELGSPSMILDAVRRGEGPGVVSVLTAADEIDAGRLVAVELADVDLKRVIQAVWLADRPLPELASRLLEAAES